MSMYQMYKLNKNIYFLRSFFCQQSILECFLSNAVTFMHGVLR